MKRNSKGWKILALAKDENGRSLELEGPLTLASATVSRMPALILWWARPGTKRFVASSTASSRSR